MVRPHFVAALALLTACSRCGEPSPQSAEFPPSDHVFDVVFVVIDTLRDDTIDQARTRTFDSVAAAGQRVKTAWSPSTWTVPSVISLFTGMPVRSHGWNHAFPRDMPDGHDTKYPPLPAAPTLAEVLRDAGFRTDGVFGNKTLTWPLGFDRGFETWDYVRDPKLVDDVSARIASWQPDERHFLYLHLLGPHHPLKPTEQARQRWELPPSLFRNKRRFSHNRVRRNPERWLEPYKKTYAAAVEDADERVGAVLDALGPRREHALVIITSDHGELLGEHGRLGHHRYVWDELAHVPLAVSGAGALPDPMRLDALADVVTTAAGVTHDWISTVSEPLPLVTQREDKLALSTDGRFKAIWGESGADGQLQAPSGVTSKGHARPADDDDGRYDGDEDGDGDGDDTAQPATEAPPVLAAPVDSPVLIYDLREDPDEQDRLEGDALGGRDEVLRSARTAWEAALPQGVSAEATVGMPADAIEELRALGYLDE